MASNKEVRLQRVYSQELDSKVCWFAATPSLSLGNLNRLGSLEIFQVLPSSLASVKEVEFSTLRDKYGTPVDKSVFEKTYQPSTVTVVSVFGMLCCLLRQRKLSGSELLLKNELLLSAIGELNGVDISSPAQHPPLSSFPANPKQNRRRKQVSFSRSESDISVRTPIRRRRIRKKLKKALRDIKKVTDLYSETLPSVLSCIIKYGSDEVKNIFPVMVEELAKDKGVKPALRSIISDETLQDFLLSLRSPDWVQLLLKLQARIPDQQWQNLLNLTTLGKSKRKDSPGILLSKNQVKAARKMIFQVTKDLIGLQPTPEPVIGFQVNMKAVLIWLVREMKLNGFSGQTVKLNLKLDGRPFWGKSQVHKGMVPLDLPHVSSQSNKAVWPLAIGNCEEDRESMVVMLQDLNLQKEELKENGLIVDGKQYSFKFSVTFDYKALLLMIKKKNNEDFQIGGKGKGQFCVFCKAQRGCDCDDTNPGETCLDCFKKSKGNIGKWKGIRDDLCLIVNEELDSVNLCALHCEMRNTGQLLMNIGLAAYEFGSLDKCNEILKHYGPENFKGNRITIQVKPKQQTVVTRSNIHVSSFSGPTERRFLENIENIIKSSLPSENVKNHFKENGPQSSLDFLKMKYSFAVSMTKYCDEILQKGSFTRDFGMKVEEVPLEDTSLRGYILERKQHWALFCEQLKSKFTTFFNSVKIEELPKSRKKKGRDCGSHNKYDDMYLFVAELLIDFHLKVFLSWKEIALVIRDAVFSEKEQDKIDIFDWKCKEWGFLLKELFGNELGSGDYGHLTIEHASMLLREHGSLKEFSNQGFEAAHTAQRQLYSRATNHDSAFPGSSVEQIILTIYAERLLGLRLCFRQAKASLLTGEQFSYPGCGWRKKDMTVFDENDKKWIILMDELFTDILSDDSLVYMYMSTGSRVHKEFLPKVKYDHQAWEKEYAAKLLKVDINSAQTAQWPLTPKSNRYLKRKRNHKPRCSTPLKRMRPSPPSFEMSSDFSKLFQDCSNSSLMSSDAFCFGDLSLKQEQWEPFPMPNNSCISDLKDCSGILETSIDEVTPRKRTRHAASLDQDEVRKVLDFSSGDSDSVNQETDLSDLCFSPNATRSQLANLPIPQIDSSLDIQDAILVSENCDCTDPKCLAKRPCEDYVLKAMAILRKSKERGVLKCTLGKFNEDSLEKLNLYCKAARIKQQIRDEKLWLLQDDGISKECTLQIANALFLSRPSQTILKSGSFLIDVDSFSTLCCERYVDNFTIDMCIHGYLQESDSRHHCIFLPTHTLTWIKQEEDFFIERVRRYTTHIGDNRLLYLLLPVNINNCHWGLVVIDFECGHLYFDDGLKCLPPAALLLDVKKIVLTLSKHIFSSNNSTKTALLMKSTFLRFGMPSQTLAGVGSGSCGVGVILSARDIINSGLQNIHFTWTFEEMCLLRKQVALKILEWKNSTTD